MPVRVDVRLDRDPFPTTRFTGKRPPSISGRTPSMTTRFLPLSSSPIYNGSHSVPSLILNFPLYFLTRQGTFVHIYVPASYGRNGSLSLKQKKDRLGNAIDRCPCFP